HRGPAIAHEMFSACQHGQTVIKIALLQTSNRRRAKALGQVGCFAEAFVGSSPSLVARDSDAGRKGPVESRGADLFRRHLRCVFHQSRVARASQTDVVREHDGIQNVVVTMDSIDAEENWNCETGFQSLALKTVVQIGPCLETVSGFWIRAAAAKQ